MDRQPTERGDREGRRRDVLDAARAILEESGWDGLGIREVASRAGVSTGAVYQWFSGKDEIFGELYEQRIRSGIELLDRLPEVGLADTVRLMLDWAIDLYGVLGRHNLEYAEATTGREGRVAAPALIESHAELTRKADDVLVAAAARDGVTLTRNPHRVTFVWAISVGVAERMLALPQVFRDPVACEEFVTFASSTLAAGLVARPGD